MTESLTPKQKTKKREKYKKWINVSVAVGVISLFSAIGTWIFIENEILLFIGLALYWAGAIGMAVGYWISPVSLRDEFHQHTEQEANKIISVFVGAIAVIGVPADVILNTTNVYTTPPIIRGFIWGYLLLVIAFGIAHAHVKRKYEQ